MLDLYDFQKDAVRQLLDGKHIIRADPGTGKTCMMFTWLERMGATKIIIATTSQKAHSGDFTSGELKKFTSEDFRARIESLECVSWDMLKKWVDTKTSAELADYVFCGDEIQKAKAGVSSKRGRAFLFLAKSCKTWAGFTATPGDTWMDYHAYFVAAGKVKHKTAFQKEFCIMQTYPFPMIEDYRNEETLIKWWKEISYAPDTSEIMKQLPKRTHQVIKLSAPKGYKKVLKTSKTLDGEFLDSNMALLHHLRAMCNTKEKIDTLGDILEGLKSPMVVFYNYTCERNSILELAQKLGRKVWRIDGERHDIPSAEDIGKTDIVLCHYLSGAEALNLQFCNYWLSYSYNWSWSTSTQARGRIDRIGQTKPMFFYYFVCEGTVEEDVAGALACKKDFIEDLWAP